MVEEEVWCRAIYSSTWWRRKDGAGTSIAPHGGGGRMVQGHPVSEGKGVVGGGGAGMARLLGHSLSSGDDVGHRNEFPIRLYLVKNNALP